MAYNLSADRGGRGEGGSRVHGSIHAPDPNSVLSLNPNREAKLDGLLAFVIARRLFKGNKG